MFRHGSIRQFRCIISTLQKNAVSENIVNRGFSSSVVLCNDQPKTGGWLRKAFRVRPVQTGKDSASSLLSNRNTVYEIQFHSVKPEFMEEYLNEFQNFHNLVQEKRTGAELLGSFTVSIGKQDEAVHIWRYDGGYPTLNTAVETYRTDKDFVQFRKNRNKMINSRSNQILLSFSFWPFEKPTQEKNIYELRTYTLKPGTMIEWGNNWARGLITRKQLETPVGGFFSNMGELYTVHHIWAYKNLQTRKELRESAWQKPGWDECVAYTVPLIRTLESRILIPTPFSPLQ
ncbi:protein NipSnap homolog 1-like isoform X1 [Tubulanus polymorphus]|uniref:protein NipSnap homolog 1-like isoform X1 n=1 Tax=Tubulanus polymorphus TaxID=672921 RepID=UPI003DA4E064